jgi:5-methylcytosine-specific restriction endonuclease McrA
MREWSKRNKEKVSAQRKARYAANPDPTRKRNAIWRASNPDKQKASNRRCYESRKEEIKARSRKWYADNKERGRKARKEWSAKNADKMTTYFREYYEAHKRDRQAYWRENRDRLLPSIKAAQHRRRARERQVLAIPFTVQQLESRLSVWGHRCWMCGKPGEHVDHVIAIARGGPHVLANLRPACARCNRRKNRKDWREFAKP